MHKDKVLLLVEDDFVDVMTVKRAVRDLKIANPLKVVGNGEEALNYLNENQDNLPCLILLDLNMPRMNGIEFLQHVKANEQLKRIPVVVLTTSKEQNGMMKSFELSAAGYMIKPVDYKKFVEMMRSIHLYWALSEIA